MTDDWLKSADKLFRDALGTLLQIEHRRKNPDQDDRGQERPDMPIDERARQAYYQANDRARLAGFLRDLATAEDWEAVVAAEEEAAVRLRVAAREVYDLRMAAKAGPAVVTANVQEAVL